MRRNTVKAHACIVGAPAPGRHIVGTQKWHTRGKHRERILPFTREWLVRFASAENGYKAPAAAETVTKRPLSRNRVSVRFPFEVVATHASAAPPLWTGLPRAAPPPPELTQSTAASAPHTIRIPPHICTSAPATHPYPIASSSSLRHRSMKGPRVAMLVHLAMTLSAVDCWGLPWDNKTGYGPYSLQNLSLFPPGTCATHVQACPSVCMCLFSPFFTSRNGRTW